MTTATITRQARRLCRQHNSLISDSHRRFCKVWEQPVTENLVEGYIYYVDLRDGNIGSLVGTWAASQPPIEMRRERQFAYLRVGHGRMTEAEAQRFIDELGEGW